MHSLIAFLNSMIMFWSKHGCRTANDISYNDKKCKGFRPGTIHYKFQIF